MLSEVTSDFARFYLGISEWIQLNKNAHRSLKILFGIFQPIIHDPLLPHFSLCL